MVKNGLLWNVDEAPQLWVEKDPNMLGPVRRTRKAGNQSHVLALGRLRSELLDEWCMLDLQWTSFLVDSK